MAVPVQNAQTTRVTVFAWLWALSVVLHLLYLANSYAAFSSFTADHIAHLALAVAAIALLIRPRSLSLLAIVCLLTPITAWYEAPRLGNHWLLASLVALALLMAMTIGAITRPRSVFDRFVDDGLPTARLIFLFVYGFCALAKFNTSFIDSEVSCANLFLNEVVQSFGFAGFDASGSHLWMRVVPWVVLAIETGVVVLLVIARTRVLGVILALVFHGVIAFDTAHAFSDFSSVIAALLVLFLPDSFFEQLQSRFRNSMVHGAALLVAAVSSVLIVWQSFDSSYRWVNAIGDVRDWMWWIVWAALMVLVVIWAIRRHSLRSDIDLRPADRSMILWPTLTLLIGLGPYLGVRVGTSWNMYSNLQTAKDSSNSFVIPHIAIPDSPQNDLVRILESSDPGLAQYIGSPYELPFINLRDHTSKSPSFSVTYERNGEISTVTDSRADPSLNAPLSWWQQKVFVFRSIDRTGATSCQNTMLAAR